MDTKLNEAARKAAAEKEEIKDRLADKAGDLKEKAGDLKEKAGDMVDNLKDKAGDLKDKAGDMIDNLKGKTAVVFTNADQPRK